MRRQLLFATAASVGLAAAFVILAALLPSQRSFMTVTAGAVAAIATVMAVYFSAVAARAAQLAAE